MFRIMSIWLNETERIRRRVSLRVVEKSRLDANNPKRIRTSLLRFTRVPYTSQATPYY